MSQTTVNLPDGRRIHFPEGMPLEQVQAEVAKLSGQPSAPTSQQPVPPTAPLADFQQRSRQGMERVVQGTGDLAKGALAGVASTVIHGGDLIRRGLGLERVIDTPEAQAAMRAPASQAGRIGQFAEQAAEFIVPGAMVGRAVRTAPLVARMAAEGATAAGVAGVQSGGDAGMMAGTGALGAAAPVAGAALRGVGRVASRAAAGAEEGGVGGAMARAIRTAVPAEPRVMLIQALKPRSTRTRFGDSLDMALPELKVTEQTLGRPIATIDDLKDAIPLAKRRVRAQYDEMAGPLRAMGSTVDLSPVAEAVAQSIPTKTLLKNPARARALARQAQAFQGRFTLEQAEQFLRETNAELEGFYQKYPFAQRKALASNPRVAGLEAEAQALRDAIYKTLDHPGQGVAARQLQRRYGALLEVEEEAIRRANVAARQQPESLAEQISNTRAVGEMVKGGWRLLHGDVTGAANIAAGQAMRSSAKFMKEQQTTDALIRRAFEGFSGSPTPVLMPPRRVVRGLLPRGPLVTSQAADPSFVRGVPAQYGQSSRLALPPGQSAAAPPKRVFAMPGEVRPDPSGVKATPAAPLEYAVDPTVTVKAGGFRVKQFSGDPAAAAEAVATPEVRGMLQRMLTDLDEFRPQRGRLVKNPNDPGFDVYAHGVAGSPIGDDIRVISEQNVSNVEIYSAIRDLLDGKRPTNRLHTAALDAAMGYLEKRPGYRGPVMGEEAFEAFSRAVDDLAD